MAISHHVQVALGALGAVAALTVGTSNTVAQTRPASASEINIPLRDARNAGPNSVRFAAAQFTKDAPTILIFGVTKANWPKLRAAMQQAVFQGYPIEGVLIGPDDAGPALEIYAKGVNVTRPINPNTISGPELTRLIRQIHQQHYGRG